MSHWIYNNTDGSSAKNDDCNICEGKKKYSFQFICDGCQLWFHTRCLRYNREKVTSQYKAYCPECNSEEIDFTMPPTLPTEVEEEDVPIQESHEITFQDIDNFDYDETMNDENTCSFENQPADSTTDTDDEGTRHIKDILAWENCIDEKSRKTRRFKVNFRKNPEEEDWYLERDLKDCSVLMEYFCAKMEIEEPEWLKLMTPEARKVGHFNSRKKGNRNNYASIKEIINKVSQYSDNDSQPIQQFEEFKSDRDGIYLLPIGEHCFVIVYFVERNLAVISEGGSAYFLDSRLRRTLLMKIKPIRKFNYVQFPQHSGSDHCASSAIAICIEFQRMLRNRVIPNFIRAPATLLNRVKKVLHKEPTQSLTGRITIQERLKAQRLQCAKCGKKLNPKLKNRGFLNLCKCSK